MLFNEDFPKVSVRAVVHRVVHKGYDPLSVEGSFKAGGRYNIAGRFGALYTSLDETTAAAEVARRLNLGGIDPAAYPPGEWWDYEVEVELDKVLDLTDPAVAASLQAAPRSLTGADVAFTRRLADEAHAAGFQAIIVPSAAIGGSKNLVVFLDKLPELPRILASHPVQLKPAPRTF